MNTADAISTYVTIGAGGTCVLLMVWVVIYFIKSLIPRLNKIEMDNAAIAEILKETNKMMCTTNDTIIRNQDIISSSQKAIENNTEAMKNFSAVLHNMSSLISISNDKLRDIEDISKLNSRDIIKICEKMKK